MTDANNELKCSVSLTCLTAIFLAIILKVALVGHCFMVQVLGKIVCMTDLLWSNTRSSGITTTTADHKIWVLFQKWQLSRHLSSALIKAGSNHSLDLNENGPLVLNECAPNAACHRSESLFSKHLNDNGKTVAPGIKSQRKWSQRYDIIQQYLHYLQKVCVIKGYIYLC